MAWAYFWAIVAWALISRAKRVGKLVVPAILILGILPDADFLLESLGVAHRTLTHSFLFWFVVFLPVFFIFRLKSVPYFVAVVQHFAFGDFLMGQVTFFWPFSSSFVGLKFGMPSIVDVGLETGGLLLASALIILNGDLKRLLSVHKSNVLMLLPLLALLAPAIFIATHWSITVIIGYILSTKLLITIAIGHLILVAFLTVSAIQGMRALMQNKIRYKKSTF
jgi:membrane-bound metal-dependent hydrolase YbcI (DUF457 family)